MSFNIKKADSQLTKFHETDAQKRTARHTTDAAASFMGCFANRNVTTDYDFNHDIRAVSSRFFKGNTSSSDLSEKNTLAANLGKEHKNKRYYELLFKVSERTDMGARGYEGGTDVPGRMIQDSEQYMLAVKLNLTALETLYSRNDASLEESQREAFITQATGMLTSEIELLKSHNKDTTELEKQLYSIYLNYDREQFMNELLSNDTSLDIKKFVASHADLVSKLDLSESVKLAEILFKNDVKIKGTPLESQILGLISMERAEEKEFIDNTHVVANMLKDNPDINISQDFYNNVIVATLNQMASDGDRAAYLEKVTQAIEKTAETSHIRLLHPTINATRRSISIAFAKSEILCTRYSSSIFSIVSNLIKDNALEPNTPAARHLFNLVGQQTYRKKRAQVFCKLHEQNMGQPGFELSVNHFEKIIVPHYNTLYRTNPTEASSFYNTVKDDLVKMGESGKLTQAQIDTMSPLKNFFDAKQAKLAKQNRDRLINFGLVAVSTIVVTGVAYLINSMQATQDNK